MPGLEEFVLGLNGLACEIYAAMAESDLDWDPTANMPPQGHIQREIESMRDAFLLCVDRMTAW